MTPQRLNLQTLAEAYRTGLEPSTQFSNLLERAIWKK